MQINRSLFQCVSITIESPQSVGPALKKFACVTSCSYGVIHKNTAARYKSRLSHLVQGMA